MAALTKPGGIGRGDRREEDEPVSRQPRKLKSHDTVLRNITNFLRRRDVRSLFVRSLCIPLAYLPSCLLPGPSVPRYPFN